MISLSFYLRAEAAGPVSPLSNSKSSRNDDDDDREDDDDDDESTFLRTSSNKTPGKSSVNFNTRKIGKKLYIQLSKGAHGLGFSITTRDNSTGNMLSLEGLKLMNHYLIWLICQTFQRYLCVLSIAIKGGYKTNTNTYN